MSQRSSIVNNGTRSETRLLFGRRAVFAVQNGLAALVHLELDHLDLGRVEANVDRGAVGLVALEALDVDLPLLPVARNDLALCRARVRHSNTKQESGATI